jgi:hypothetical protein
MCVVFGLTDCVVCGLGCCGDCLGVFVLVVRGRTGDCVGVGAGVGVGFDVGFLCGVVKSSVSGSSCGPRSGCGGCSEIMDYVRVVSAVVFIVFGGRTLKIPQESPLPRSRSGKLFFLEPFWHGV